MPEPTDRRDRPGRDNLGATVKFNPHLWGDEELRAVFVARTRELEEILKRIRSQGPDRVPQHLLITGHRGMGKTTLLRRLALAVREDPELSPHWIALTFPEEQYTVSNLGELWGNVLDALADTLEQEGVDSTELARLDQGVQAALARLPAEREAATLDLLEAWVTQHQRRILLLIDSTDLLFDGLGRGERAGKGGAKGGTGAATPLWRLRKTLSHQAGLFWIGASYQALESDHPYGEAFHDFFELFELRPLRVEEMHAAMLALARTFGAGQGLRGDQAVAAMAQNLAKRPERLKTLRALTGGNPRTTVILYELFAAGWEGDVHTDLKALLDVMTPLYKARMEQLAEQPRKLLAHLLEHWAPISAGELAGVSGITNTTVSAQLTRLEQEGLVEKADLVGTRRSGYQASERFFNVWYLMRNSPRRVRRRLTWLVEFMRLWFSAEELRDLARRQGGRLAAGRHPPERLQHALALADALPDDSRERHQLEWSVLGAAHRLAEEARESLLEALPELLGADGDERPFVTAEDYLRRFKALDTGLARCPHPADEAERRAWIEAVKGSLSLHLSDKEQLARDSVEYSAGQYREILAILEQEKSDWLASFGPTAPRTAREAVLRGDLFPDYPDPRIGYQQISAQLGGEPSSLRFGLTLYELAHQNEWTERLYRRAIELDPKSASPWNGFGNLLKNLGRHDEAEAAYRRAIELDPKDAHPRNGLGNLLQYHLGRHDEAEAAYRRAIELDPKFAHPWSGLGNLLQDHLGRHDEAEAAYCRAIELDPKDATPWNDLGNLLRYHLGRHVEAEAAYRRAIELDPKSAYPWNGLGNLLQYRLGRHDEAEAAYRRAIELDPKSAYPWNGLGNLLQYRLGRHDEAEAAYRRAIELDPKSAYPWNGLGNLLQYRLGRHDEAEAAYRCAIELDPKYATPWNGLGNLLQDHLSRHDEAEAAYRRAIELDPKFATPWYNLGNLLQVHLGRHDEAEAAYRRAIELDPKFATPWNNLGNLLQDHLGRYSEAEEAYRRAIALDADEPYFAVNLARLLARRGERAEATDLYRRIAECTEGQANLRLQAALWLGNRDTASLALAHLAEAADEGDALALFRLQEQARECHGIGLGPALAELMEGAERADLLRPIALALRAANGDDEALKGLPPEMRTMAETVLTDLLAAPEQ